MTAYDYPMAKLLDDADLDFLLVGDSLGMVVLGYPDTTGVRMEDMLHHTRAVARGATKTWIVSDLPAGSYPTPEAAVENSLRLIEAGADAVKIEGGRECLRIVLAIRAAGIPVVGHLGMLPQRVREEGGYHIKGRSEAEAARRAGMFAPGLPPPSPRVCASRGCRAIACYSVNRRISILLRRRSTRRRQWRLMGWVGSTAGSCRYMVRLP